MRYFFTALTALVLVLGQLCAARAELRVNTPGYESKGDYARGLQKRTQVGLGLIAGVNLADMMVACPLDDVLIARAAMSDTVPLVSGLAMPLYTKNHELYFGRLALEIANSKFKDQNSAPDASYEGLLRALYAERGEEPLGDYETGPRISERPIILGSVVALLVASAVDAWDNGTEFVMNRDPVLTGPATLKRTVRYLYLPTEAEYRLSFRNDYSHCSGSLRKLRQIAGELASRRREDGRDAKRIEVAPKPAAAPPGPPTVSQDAMALR